MAYITITGLHKGSLDDLLSNNLKTLEIRSPHNFFSLIEVDVGTEVFLTTSSLHDLNKGTIGIMAEIVAKTVSMHRVFQGIEGFFEEHETLMARIQVRPINYGRIVEVKSNIVGKAVLVEIHPVTSFDAR